MLKKLMAIALSVGAIAAALPATTAEARVRGAHSGGIHAGHHVMHVGRPVMHVHRFHHRRYVAPIYFASPVIYRDGCYWLKRRAIETGSRYWWHRYRHCRDY